MKKLKKNTRLNDEIRRAIAASVVDTQMGEKLLAVQDKLLVVADQVYGAILASFEVNSSQLSELPDGVLPKVSAIQVPNDKEVARLPLVAPIAIPFGYLHHELPLYEEVVDKKLKAEVKAALKEQKEIAAEEEAISIKVTSFLQGFSSPAKLLDAAPDFVNHLPDSVFVEDGDEKQITLEDILQLSQEAA